MRGKRRGKEVVWQMKGDDDYDNDESLSMVMMMMTMEVKWMRGKRRGKVVGQKKGGGRWQLDKTERNAGLPKRLIIC